MTEKPDDRELEQYLQGGSALSHRYREASREPAPPQLDESVLALARAEAKRKPRPGPWFAGLALAASLALGVNLAWNLREQAGPPTHELTELDREDAPSPRPYESGAAESIAAPRAEAAAPAAPTVNRQLAPEQRRDTADALGVAAAKKAEQRQRTEETMSLAPAESGAVTGAAAAPVPRLTEPQKIELLLGYLERQRGAVFIRNGREQGPEEAVSHLRMKLEAAGERVRTAGDFIECCASRSSTTGEPYRVRFADGTVRAAADVFVEQLAEIEAASEQ